MALRHARLLLDSRHRHRLKRHIPLRQEKEIRVVIPEVKSFFYGAGNERPDGRLQIVVFVIEEAPHENFRSVKTDLVIDIKLPSVKSRR
jgi:hypothetical protein